MRPTRPYPNPNPNPNGQPLPETVTPCHPMQPIVSLDWSPHREGLCTLACLDQTLRVYIVTKLHKF